MPTDFKSDGCSGGISWFLRAWGIPPCLFEACCLDHDKAYFTGGTRVDRLKADVALYACWRRSGVPRRTARLGFWAIRLFGGPYYPAPWRWGFRRAWPRRYDREMPA